MIGKIYCPRYLDAKIRQKIYYNKYYKTHIEQIRTRTRKYYKNKINKNKEENIINKIYYIKSNVIPANSEELKIKFND